MKSSPNSPHGPERGDLLSAAEAGLRRRGMETVSEPASSKPEIVPNPPAPPIESLIPTVKISSEGPMSGEDLFPPRPEYHQETQKGRLGVLERASKAVRAVLAGAMLLGATAGATMEASAKGSTPVISATEKTKETTTKGRRWFHFDNMFQGKDKTGAESGWNLPWAIISPFQADWSGEDTVKKTATTAIPYEYARQFAQDPAADKPLRPADRDKVMRHTEDEMKRKFVEKLSTLGTEWNVLGSRSVQRHHHGESAVHQGKVTSITITGFASPEGPRSKGPSTLEIGKVDPENEQLAKRRAESMVAFTGTELDRISAQTGISVDVLKEAIKNVQGKEDQWSPAEMDELQRLASSSRGVDDAERVYNLVADYNEGRITDPNMVEALDRLVGAKRRVEITVTSEGNQKTTWLIPIPLTLFLPLLGYALRRHRRKPPEQTSPSAQAPAGQGTPPPQGPRPTRDGDIYAMVTEGMDGTAGMVPQQPPKRDASERVAQVPELVRTTQLPPPGLPEFHDSFEDIEERTYIDDLYHFIEDADTVRRGIDYHAMADRMCRDFDTFDSDEGRVLVLADEILDAWQKHDRRCRVEAGVPEGELDNGLNYKDQPRQIQFAKMHARGVLEMAKHKLELPEEVRDEMDYPEILSSHVERLIARRVARQEASGR